MSNLSINENIFTKSKEIYHKVLKISGYRQTLKDRPGNENVNKKRNRKRNAIGFNPPFCVNVKTKVRN